MIYYFSGTGNSLWAAKKLGELLNEPVESLIKYRKKSLKCMDAVVGLVCPLYMWKLPSVVKAILEQAVLGENSYIFLVLTSNNGEKNLGDRCPAYKSMESLVEKAGGKLASVFMLQMPGNALESSPEENQQRLEAAPDRVKQFAEEISHKVCNYVPQPEISMAEIIQSGILREMMHSGNNHGMMDAGKLKERMKARKYQNEEGKLPVMGQFTVLDDCNGCGVCARVCPMDNISIVDGKAIHGVDCASCLACLHWCPKHATVSQLSLLKKRSQYTHPEVTVKDMTESKE